MRRGGGAYSLGNKPRIYGGGAVRHFPVVRHFSVFPAACFTVFSPRRKSRAATVSTSMASYMSAIRLGSAARPHPRIRIHRQFARVSRTPTPADSHMSASPRRTVSAFFPESPRFCAVFLPPVVRSPPAVPARPAAGGFCGYCRFRAKDYSLRLS